MPTISVIVPVYNVEKYLARCLDSILYQTFTDFEVICINDGSKDGSLTILQEYAQKDARIIILNQENQGLSMARNNGMKVAQGEYISFVDSDDAIEPQCLEIAYTLITEHQADIACWNFTRAGGYEIPNTHFCIESLHIITTNKPLDFYNTPTPTQHMIRHNVWDKLYRRSFISSLTFPMGLYYEDVPFSWQVMLRHPKVTITSKALYLYTRNPNSIMERDITIKHVQDYHSIIKLIYSSINSNNTETLEVFKKISIAEFVSVQIGWIKKLQIAKQLPLWKAFEEQLRDLDEKNLLPAYDKKQKKHFRVYNYILQYGAEAYYQNKVLSWRKKPLYTMRTRSTKTYYIFGFKLFVKEKLSIKKRAIHILGMTFTYTKK